VVNTQTHTHTLGHLIKWIKSGVISGVNSGVNSGVIFFLSSDPLSQTAIDRLYSAELKHASSIT